MAEKEIKLANDFGTWDKECACQLRSAGLNQDQIGIVIGMLAEHRQRADNQGFVRGYESGFERGAKKLEMLYIYRE